MLKSQGIHHQQQGYFLPQRDRGPSKPKMPQGPQRPPKAEAKLWWENTRKKDDSKNPSYKWDEIHSICKGYNASNLFIRPLMGLIISIFIK